MAKLYEMCNEINSDELLSNREDLTQEEKDKLLANLKESKEVGRESGQENIKKKKHKKSWGSYIGKVAVAAALVILIVPNVSAHAAYAMSQIPIL